MGMGHQNGEVLGGSGEQRSEVDSEICGMQKAKIKPELVLNQASTNADTSPAKPTPDNATLTF